MIQTYIQTPNEKIDYQINLRGGDTASSSVWTSDDTHSVLVIGSPVLNLSTVKARISGGTVGVSYLINCHIVGLSGQEYDVYFSVMISLYGRPTNG